MEVDVSVAILDYEGKPVRDDRTDEVVTFRAAWSHALNREGPDEKLGVSEKDRAYALCQKLYRGPKVRLDVDERKMIVDRVAMFFSPLIVGRTKDVLDPASRDEPEAESGLDRPATDP